MLRFVLLTSLYLLCAWYATAFIHAPGEVTLFWPAAGVAYAAMVVYGWRGSWFIPVSVLIMHLTFVPVPTALIPFSIASNVLGALAGWWVIALSKTEIRISVTSGFALLRGGAVMSIVSALIGCYGLMWAQMIPASHFWSSFLTWSMGDLVGVICVSPSMVMLLQGGSGHPDMPRAADYSGPEEKTIWALSLVLSFVTVYWGGLHNSYYALGMVALPIALLLWSAIRFQPVWTALGTSLTVLFLTSLTGLGLSDFKPPKGELDIALLLGFMGLIATIPLVLVASIHQQRQAVRKVLRRATTDAATNLPNRAAFEEAVQRALRSDSNHLALAYLDLDHFTVINDIASHAAGDALIHGIGSLLKARAGQSDRIFRIGGDEFALLLEGDAEAIRTRLDDLLRSVENYRVGWQTHVLNITVSIGLVNFKPGDLDYARLLSLADAACFTAKEMGGNRICVASQEPGDMFERTRAMHWSVRIREAIDSNLLELYCQAVMPLHNQPIEGHHFEVLVRMRDPASGEHLLPGQFIPAAERFQQGVALDKHMVNLTLDWLESHPETNGRVHTCSINLTAGSMVDEGFRKFLFDRVRESRFPAFKLCFEVTETSAVRDMARAQALIAQMRSIGCSFALDDFGTGFCSFNYLRTLDVDYFKIDGSFVRDLESSPLSMSVIRSITDIAHVLNKQTIAEHAENDKITAALHALGVDFAQGFGLHRPQPIAQFFANTTLLRPTL